MSRDSLFELLPAIHRLRDGQSGRVLEALLAIVQGQVDRVATDIEDLYDDWFIETCRDWVVPYLGELVSSRGHYAFGDGALSLRAFVANTLNFRRRKGTASMLEDLASSVTGWPCRALELFTRVATTQHVNHPRPSAPATIGLRSAAALELLAGPFDPSCRTVDVRSVEGGRPRHNVANVALFLFRLIALEAVHTTAVADSAAGVGRFRFDPLGVDRTLFGPARTLSDLALDVEEPDVPGPLRRRALYDELSAARAAIAAGDTPRYRHFSAGQAAFTLTVVGEPSPIPPEQIQICNLQDWALSLPTPAMVTRPDGSSFSTRAAVDPLSGRIAIIGSPASAISVTYRYPVVSDVGASHSARPSQPAADAAISVMDWTLAEAPDLAAALSAWSTAGGPDQTLEVVDSGRYSAPAALSIPGGRRLTLRARVGERPVLRLSAPWSVTLGPGARLSLEGLLIEGSALELDVQSGAGVRSEVELNRVSLVPGRSRNSDGASSSPGAVVLSTANTSSGGLRLSIDRSIAGAIDLTPGAADFSSEIHISDSVLDAGFDAASGSSPALRARDVFMARCTVFGAVAARTLTASDAIFAHTVSVERTQTGCVRFCYVLPESKIPRSYRCQPALALAALGADAALVNARVKPIFTALRFGDAGYAQLDRACPEAISAGGSDGSEMGVYFHLHQPQREENLRRGLDEYLRFGLEAGLVFVT